MLHVNVTDIVGDTLWGVDTRNGEAVVWDQKRGAFRIPTQQESMGADAHAKRKAVQSEHGTRTGENP